MNGDRQLSRLAAARARVDETRELLHAAQRADDLAVRELTTAVSAIVERVRLSVDEPRTLPLPLSTTTRSRGAR